ncbi:carboxylating nicotinate-nucleotide diphosphorylase [Oligoflexia bacterium]|nr:carboxylating nicotinate-nucleotide diphosphorylase [Oligoflexia bacterium]
MQIWNNRQVQKLIALALDEDLGSGDVTSELCVGTGFSSFAKILARQDLMVCGIGAIEAIFASLGAKVEVVAAVADGDVVMANTPLATLSGATSDLLAAERIILNFLQRLSGIASHCNAIAVTAPGLVLLDTRKTTPGWRMLEKYAVRTGGGHNHRNSLGDMILVKDNHIDANGGDVRATLKHINQNKPPYMPVEVEVRSLEELEVVLECGCDVVMLDNMGDRELEKALAMLKQTSFKVPLVEVSGGVTDEHFEVFQTLGVACVSMGALTTQATWVDISMCIESA